MRTRTALFACLSVVCCALPAAAAERIKVAYNSLLPPFAEAKDGKAVGLVVDIFRAAAEKAGYEVDFVAVPLDQMEPSLSDGRAVVVMPTAATPERRQRLDFSETLLMTGGSLYVRAPDATPAGLKALAGKTVVTPKTGPLAAFIQRTAPEVKLVVTENYETSLAKLVSGEADAAALNHQTGGMLANRLHPGKITMPSVMFLELPFGAAVLKGRHGELLAKLNAGLAAIRADGTWEKINAAWMKK